MLFAGLDISTQSCKLIIINTKSEETEFSASVNYDTDLPEFKTKNGVIEGLPEGVSESNPLMWIKGVDLVFEKLLQSDVQQDKIECVSVSGQQHGLVALYKNGKLSRPTSKLWNDFSTQNECEYLTEVVGGTEKMIKEIGNTQRTGYTASKILHMKNNEPELYKKTAIFFLVHNYINWFLTGGVAVMEPGDVSGMALWNPTKNAWSNKVINAIDSELKSKLPIIKPSNKTIGYISTALVEKFGFSKSCKIDAGCGDNMYGAIGTGNIEQGIATISLGTSGTVYTFLEKPFIDMKGEISSFCDSTGNYLSLLCVSNLANGYNQILKKFNISHKEFNEIVKKTPKGNNGKILIPWFEGERTPDVPMGTPTYFGFALNDFTKENLCRAVIEGAVLNLYDGFTRMPVDVKEIRLTGGLSKSSVWRETIADIFEAEVVPVDGEGAAMGAAIHAAWVWNKEEGNSVVLPKILKPFVKLIEEERTKPDFKNHNIYRIQKKMFSILSKNLRNSDSGDIFKLRTEILALSKKG
ncbi:MAG: xylulokinase [Melioribacteraceae bacterium]|nr:xylulokinase [Melioribacteraceae bacterium]